MTYRVAVAVLFLLICGGGSVLAGPCGPHSTRNCLKLPPTINFDAVPEISDQIVRQEPVAAAPRKISAAPASEAPSPYTGPMVGVNSRSRTPTVGYYWSLD
jgi:hypothetical protein